MPPAERHDLALFIDFENIALGLRGRTDTTFDIQKVLQRLLEIGNVLVKRAYCDWSRFGYYTKPFHEAAIELIEIPRRGDSGKNSADIRLCVDAMDLCYAKEHIDTFVILSGDSDFSPLVSKLRENGKRVIGLGLRGSTSNLLVSNCDEFIFYESLDRHAAPRPVAPQDNRMGKETLLQLVTETVAALVREGRDPIQASLVKDTIKRKQPSFNEGDYGYRSFTEALEDAQSRSLIQMREDPRSGTYLVTINKPSPEAERPAPSSPAQPATTTQPSAAAQPAQPAAQPAPAAVQAPAASQPQRHDFARGRGRGRGRGFAQRPQPAQAATPAPQPEPIRAPEPMPAEEQPASEPTPAIPPVEMPKAAIEMAPEPRTETAPEAVAPEPTEAASAAPQKPQAPSRRRAPRKSADEEAPAPRARARTRPQGAASPRRSAARGKSNK